MKLYWESFFECCCGIKERKYKVVKRVGDNIILVYDGDNICISKF